VDTLTLIGVAVALAMDAFAVALAAGAVLQPLRFRPCFRLAFHFGLFQALMPVIGWLAGRTVQSFVSTWTHWIAFALLLYIGVRMIHEALSSKGEDACPADPSRGLTMVGLAVATSIDALAVGLSLAMLDVVVWFPALVIGLVACAFTVLGLFLGTWTGKLWGTGVEVAGGVILILIGCKILFSALVLDNAVAGIL
jgi:putative Mn2+ efflux pump MntP